MRELNQAFGEQGEGKYATAIVLSYHRVKGHLVFSNAGHLPPLWYQAAQQTWSWLQESAAPQSQRVSGLPVGLIPGTDYIQTVVSLAPEDLLVLYTDGITEAENTVGQDVGREHFLEWANHAPTHHPAATGMALLEQLELFRGDSRQDDATLLVLQRKPELLPKVLCEIAGRYASQQLRNLFRDAR
jgi:sigma-B regulation protein RsbU (phosphoserine phosphatase)